jgi:hypothetical protein
MRITKVPRLALWGVAFLLVVGFLLIVSLLSGVNYSLGLTTTISPGALTHHFCYPARPVAS